MRSSFAERSASGNAREALGLSRAVARKYLERLVEIGDAVVTVRYGQTGRRPRRDAVTPGRARPNK